MNEVHDSGIFSWKSGQYVGVNIGGAGSYVYENPTNNSPPGSTVDSAPKPQEKWVPASSRLPSKGTNNSRNQLTYSDLYWMCKQQHRGYMHLPLATNNCVLNVLHYNVWQITVYLNHRVNAPLISAGSITTFSGEANLCPRCNKKVYFGMFLSVLIAFHTVSWILIIGNE